MKKAFTMIELVFVIVIVGIISVMIAPSFDRNNLREAADQVVSHIRYTQHLAMMDNKFIPNANMSRYTNQVQKDKEAEFYYKGRWQIHFFNVGGETPNLSFTAYAVYADSPSTVLGNDFYDGSPSQTVNLQEVARNPEDPNRFLIGANNASFTIGNDHITSSMNLNSEFAISLVDFNGGCANAHRVAFDYLGRPIGGDLSTSIAPYEIGDLFNTQCQIVLCQNTPCDDDNITIAIEPETGYTHIL